MKLCQLVFFGAVAAVVALGTAPQPAAAGGLFLPGAGAVSTSRAGAAVASADDGEALVLNPAGIAKASGTTITVSAELLDYAMQFQRRGTYDDVPMQNYPYAGQPFPTMRNDASPALGIGSFQPLPVIAVLSDLGGRAGGLHVGAGIYAPTGYPFRDMCTELPSGCDHYTFNSDSNPPPTTRYDIMKQDASVLLPSVVAAYHILPALDVGARFSAGLVSLKSTTALWSTLTPNYEEDVAKDGTVSIDAKDNFVPGWGLGATYRPTPFLEFGFNYASELDIHVKGTAISQLGPSAVNQLGPTLPVGIAPVADNAAVCAPGGTAAALKACVDFALPRNAQLGGRFKFLDAAGQLKGDLELDLDWENWGKSCSTNDFNNGTCTTPGDYRVVVDAQAVIAGNTAAGIPLKPSVVSHGLQDSYAARLGGSYHIAIGPPRADGTGDELILRGGVGFDTSAARTGWLRADFDGAARTTFAIGAAYRLQHVEFSLGGGASLEGSPSNPNVGGGAQPCNPTAADPTCNGSAVHQGPDPVNPTASTQTLNPVNQGDYKSHYLMFMFGATTWF